MVGSQASGLEKQVAALEKKKEHVKESIDQMKKAAAGKKGDPIKQSLTN